jgi:hypothetical protein
MRRGDGIQKVHSLIKKPPSAVHDPPTARLPRQGNAPTGANPAGALQQVLNAERVA